MKKIISLIGIIMTFAVLCAFITGCGNNSVGETTVPTIPGLASSGTAASTSAQTMSSSQTSLTDSTTKETTKATSKTTEKTTTKITTKATTKATTVKPKNITIFLDPGHGGDPKIDGGDPGVIRTYGGVTYEEADINLAVALYAKKELEKRGYTVVMSRETDKNVALSSRAPMAQRAGAAMFISIHVNSFSDPSVAGPRMYYTHRTGLSYAARNFAAYFAEEFDDIREVPLSTDPDKLAYPNMKLARIASDKDLYKGEGYLAVLAATEIPSVLIEMGFITNDNDLAMLKSQWWQIYVGRAIADAVDRAYADGVYAK